MGFAVHKKDQALLQQLNDSLRRLQPKIHQLLSAFAVPTLDTEKETR
jgi:hypothetical protein